MFPPVQETHLSSTNLENISHDGLYRLDDEVVIHHKDCHAAPGGTCSRRAVDLYAFALHDFYGGPIKPLTQEEKAPRQKAYKDEGNW
jgi:hypothetical protein